MTSGTAPEPQLEFTEAAAKKLSEVIAGHHAPIAGLHLALAGRGPEGFAHALSLVEEGGVPEDVVPIQVGDISVFVKGGDARYLDGVKVHYEDKGPEGSGLEFENPNPLWFDELSLSLQELLDTQINPNIASHGGYVSLIAVEEDAVYIEMGGGCQGCGMADVTLKQGIEVAIMESVPEIKHVFDTTDHAAGNNPYFTPEKK